MKKVYKDRLVYVYIFLMIVGLFFRNAMGVGIPVVFFVLLSAIPLIIGDNDHMLAVVVSCIATSAGFQYKYVLFLFILAFVIKSKGKIRKSPVLFIVLAMALWEFAHCFYGDFSFVEWLRSFAELFTLAIVTCMNIKKIDYKMIYRVFCLALVGVCFVMLYLQYQQGSGDFLSIFTRSASNFRFGMENTNASNFSLNLNPNGLGARCGIAIILMISLHIKRENTKIDTVLMIFAILFGVATLSRTFILCTIIAVVGFAILSGSIKQRIKYILGAVFFGIFIYILLSFYFPIVIDNLAMRFRAEDISNGRTDLFAFYLNHILSTPFFFLFGIGMQNISSKLYSIYGYFDNVCHNGIQEIWVLWGIVGVVLFIVLIFEMISMAKQFSRRTIMIQYIPLLYILIFSMGGQLITSSHMLLALILAYINIAIDYRSIDKIGGGKIDAR